MTSYYRVMLGRGSSMAPQCREERWFGGGWNIGQDLTADLTDDWRSFNTKFIPVFLAANPGKPRVTAGLACGMLHTICKDIKLGDIVLCPNGQGTYWVGKVVSDYFYQPGQDLPHRRRVEWLPTEIPRADISQALRRSSGSIGAICNITKYATELAGFIGGDAPPELIATDPDVEDATVFGLESHLEDFLVDNWSSTEVGKTHDIYKNDDGEVAQQFPTDTGRIDILAIRKDRKELLVVELKKGRASDKVVGQTHRYMGYIMDVIAEPGQTVRGCIIALEDDLGLRRALRAATNIDFYRYKVDFKLFKA
jgi:restriction system protein